MAPQRLNMSRIVRAGCKDVKPSASDKHPSNVCDARNRKRSADCLSNAADSNRDVNDWLTQSVKKRKVAPADTVGELLGPNREPSSPDADSGYSSVNENLDVAHAAEDTSREPAKGSRGGIDTSLPPLSDVRQMFEDLVARIDPVSLKNSPFKLNVATLCSGTDAPIFALNLIQDAMQAMGYDGAFEFEHLFSCEIEPFKQGFIRRNLPHGTIIFRDVVELAGSKGQATTAGGSKAAVPDKPLDILFAGCSCVDYSNLNQNKPCGRVPSLDRHLKRKVRGDCQKKASMSEEPALPRVAVDHSFVEDLDRGLDELLEVSAGESARTFFAAIKLITVLRPRFVVLENVIGAPWDMYTGQIFPKIGYAAQWLRLDSKEFYLPQTRQRGYLVAVDAVRFGKGLAWKVVGEWRANLPKCKRPPSASISAFLQPPDEPATIQARAEMETKGLANAEWALCSLRHADARQKNAVRRDDNPFSKKAMRSGRLVFALYPSHSWLRFWEAQVTRIVDLMDIAYAVANTHGVDLGFKTGMIDVSQNVDRNHFVGSGSSGLKNLGIVGCITPTGLPIVTDLMRPVTGTETLSLQGLPVDELVISTETQGQLRDLAGNAMSVTVVGAVTLTLLLAASEAESTCLDRTPSVRPKSALYLDAPPDELLEPGRPKDITAGVSQLLTIASRMVRVCYCLTPACSIFVCSACGATACSFCRGNPEHRFGTEKVAVPELSADHGRTMLKNLLPNALILPIPLFVIKLGLALVENELYRKVVSGILSKQTVYFFDEIKVTETVTVCFKAADSIAQLVLSPISGCQWYIYLAPWHAARARLSKAFDFDQPVARGQFLDGNTVPQWSVWAVGRVDLNLRLTTNPAGALVAGSLSLAGDHCFQSDSPLLAWKQTVEAKLCGTYSHHPKCGTPGGVLRIKNNSTPSERVFMMWESAGLRDPALDHFVFTDSVRRLEPHEYRETFLHVSPRFKWNAVSESDMVDAFWPGYWFSSSTAVSAPTPSKPMLFDDLVQVHWGSAEAIGLATCHAQSQPLAAHMPVLATISATVRDLPKSVVRLPNITACTANNSFYVVPASGCDAFLKAFSFLSVEFRLSRLPRNTLACPHLRGQWVMVDRCEDCSVTPPEITVYTKENLKASSRGDKRLAKVFIEDADQAALFESQYQDLPRAMAVAARLQCRDNGWSTVDVRLMLQPKTLASRALAHLLQAHRTPSRGHLSLKSDAKTFFTVTLDFASPPTVGFAPFAESVRPCGQKFSEGIGLARGAESERKPPPRFSRGSQETSNPSTPRYELRPSQKDAVTWMLQREQVPLDFVKCEIEEEVVAPLSLRVVGKAEWVNRFPYSSRGGVVAHEIGYGKTVVTLALLDYMREFDKGKSIDERKEKVDCAWAGELSQPFKHLADADSAYASLTAESFFCHLAATLVIVPKHITDQWANEVQKFLGLEKPELLVIRTTKAFYEAYRLEDLLRAEIIVVSSAVFGSGFLDRLQTVAGRGSDYPKGLFGRTLETWYLQALRNIRVLTASYLAGRAAKIPHGQCLSTAWSVLLPELILKQQAAIDKLVERQVPEIDRRLYKKARNIVPSVDPARSGEGKGRRGKKHVGKEAGEDEAGQVFGESEWDISWLHNCSFARVIWDECSYDDDSHIPLFVANTVANAKWLISGTPKLFGLEQICKIANAFGIHVARPEPRMMPGLPPVTKGPELEPMSKSEEFHVYSSQVRSTAVARERHSCAQRFVASYFRANALEPDMQIQFEEHVRPVAMTTSNMVRYHLLNQEVLDAGYDYTALPAYARKEVAIKGSELASKDGQAAAKMLMDLLACGIGGDGGPVIGLQRDLSKRAALLSGQLKLLWDKTMWLWRWICELIAGTDEKFKLSPPVQDTITRINLLCGSFSKALLEDGSFEEFGGMAMFQREAAVVAAVHDISLDEPHDSDPDVDSLRTMWQPHFEGDWAEQYGKNKALYTWLDFFHVESSTLDRLTGKQLRVLAEDICWLRYKADRHAKPLDGALPRIDFLRTALAIGGEAVSRAIPANMDALAKSDSRVLGNLSDDELRSFLCACIVTKPAPQTWQQAKGSFKVDLPAGKRVKERLQERAVELNLKFYANHSVDKLKETLWQHEHGLTVCEQYRDGRAPPDRQRDLQAAIECGGTSAKQAEAANEELKGTMVHLAKTVEDLRATQLESEFVPAFSSLADADDKDGMLRTKTCGCCRRPLVSASSSFLVVACGHFLCAECKSSASFYCPVKDCAAFIRQRPVLRCSLVPQPSADGPRTKADCVAELIRNEIPQEDYVVVFAQYRPMIDALAGTFKNAKLSFLNLAALGDDDIAGGLEKFKSGKAGQVLLLDMDSETSAGSNLTIATHVIFANPYVHHDEEHQARMVRQARGRCIRTGQTRKVHVYHFMVSGTIEEETLRKFGRDSPAVRGFFEVSGSIPWWLDEEVAAGEANQDHAQEDE